MAKIYQGQEKNGYKYYKYGHLHFINLLFYCLLAKSQHEDIGTNALYPTFPTLFFSDFEQVNIKCSGVFRTQTNIYERAFLGK